MLQFRAKVGLLTDGDIWFVFYADVLSPDPSNDRLRVARFERFGAGSEIFSGNPWAILLAALMLADPEGLPPRPRPLVRQPTIARVSSSHRFSGPAPSPSSGPMTRTRARGAAAQGVGAGPDVAGQAYMPYTEADDTTEREREDNLESEDHGQGSIQRRLVSCLPSCCCAIPDLAAIDG